MSLHDTQQKIQSENLAHMVARIQKSTNVDGRLSSLDVSFEGRPDLANDPVSLVRLAGQNPWIGAAVRKLAWACGRVVPRVYAEGSVGKLYTPHKAASSEVIKDFQQRNKAASVVELTNHPLTKFLSHPSTDDSWHDLCGLAIGYESVIGNSYFEIIRVNKKPVGMAPLMSEWVSILLNPDSSIRLYRYSPPVGQPRNLNPDDVFHSRLVFPGSVSVGHGMLETAIKDGSLLNAISDQEIAMARNGATPSLAITVKNYKGSQKDAEVMAESFMSKFGGRRMGRPFVSFGDVDAKPIGLSPKDMAYAEGRTYLRSAIAAAFGIPEDLLWSGNANRASSVTAMRSFKEQTALPMLGQFLDQFNTQVSAEYGSNVWVWYDARESLEQDPVEQSTVLTNYVKGKILTVDEARAAIGMPPLGGEAGGQQSFSVSAGAQ